MSVRSTCQSSKAHGSVYKSRDISTLTSGHLSFVKFGKQGWFRIDLTRFNKIATQGAPQMAVDKEANSLSRVYSYYSKFILCLFYM